MKIHDRQRGLRARLFLGSCFALLAFASMARADFDLYTNGPVDITDNAYAISGPLAVSNSFTLSGSSTIAVIDGIGLICLADTTPASLTWALGTSSFGTEITGPNFLTPIYHKVGTTTGGDDVFSLTIDTGNIDLDAGTYWLTLSNGVTSLGNGHELYWTVTSGPSLAFQQEGSDTPVSVPSDSFTIVGVPEPSTYVLLGVAAVLIGLRVRRRIFLR